MAQAKPGQVLCETRENQILWNNLWSRWYPARPEQSLSFKADVPPSPLKTARNCKPPQS